MAIQVRRGVYSRFDPTRLLPGEWAVVQSGDSNVSDGKAVYICFAAGDVKRIATVNDMAEYLDNMTAETIAEITAEVGDAIQAAENAAEDAIDAKEAAESAASDASDAADAANTAAAAAEAIVDYSVPVMSASMRGGAKLGDGLEVDANEKLNVKPATTSAIGGVKADGSTITVDSDGTIHGSSSYSLPTMSASTKGGAKLGSGLEVGSDDKLNVKAATASAIGGVKPDGTTVTVDSDGTIHSPYTYSLPTMSSSTKGGAKVGTGLAMSGDALGLSGESYSSTEKSKLAGIEANANNYSLPTMSPTTKGGAKVGHGLSVDGEALNLGPLTDSGSGASVETDGCGIFGITGDGFAHQDGTPSPSNPQEIKVARGRNLYNFDSLGTRYACSATVSDQVLTISNITDSGAYVNDVKSSPQSYSAADAGQIVEVEPNTTYCVSISNSALNVNLVNSYNANKESIGYSIYRSNVFTFTTSSTTKYVTLRFGFSGAVVGATYKTTIQLEKGSTPTPYVPYGSVGLEIALPVSTLEWENGSLGVSAGITYESAKGSANNIRLRSAYPVRCSCDSVVFGINAGNFVSAIACNNGIVLRNEYTIGGITSIDMSGADSVAFYVYHTDDSEISVQDISSIGLFAIIVTPIPLPAKGFAGAIGDYVDTLEVDSAGGYVWGCETGETIFDGSSSFSYGQTAANAFEVAALSVAKPVASNNDTPTLLSSHGHPATANHEWSYSEAGDTAINISGHVMFIVPSVSSTSEAKTWLASNNVTVLYPINATTESGYIALPELPAGATVSIPELETIGVEWWVEGAEAMAEHGRDVSKANKEQGDRITELEAAVANLATS